MKHGLRTHPTALGTLGGGLIDRRSVFGFGDRFSLFTGGLEPGFFGDLDLFEGFFGGIGAGGTGVEIGDVGDITAVGVAVEDVNMIVFHAF